MDEGFANNHPLHAVGIGLAAGALAKVAGAENTTALVVGGGTGAGAYWYMSTYGHTFPPGAGPAPGPAAGPATGIKPSAPPAKKPTQPSHPVRPVGGLPAQPPRPQPPRPQPPRPQPPRPAPRPPPNPVSGILDIALAPVNLIGGLFSSIFG
jgi:hypothetical protein